jgi:hypothetical protein
MALLGFDLQLWLPDDSLERTVPADPYFPAITKSVFTLMPVGALGIIKVDAVDASRRINLAKAGRMDFQKGWELVFSLFRDQIFTFVAK